VVKLELRLAALWGSEVARVVGFNVDDASSNPIVSFSAYASAR
jgi:hypothetical protein